MSFRAEILLDLTLPMELYTINPRTILGDDLWNNERKLAYKRNKYYCCAT
jgi:hypothetical protein